MKRKSPPNDTLKMAKKCDFPGCSESGTYRAPKTRALNEYYWFCLKHVTDYNKNWDFYRGLDAAQIEQHLVNDMTWQRPTWKLGHGGIRSASQIKDRLGILNDLGLGMDGRHNPPQTTAPLDEKIRFALAFMELRLPLELNDLKRRYKLLAKKFHPDANRGDTDSLRRFQTLNESYHTLIAFIKGER